MAFTTIIVTSGTGEGHTAIAAFDAALFQAGIANYNLVHLSSVIPPNVNVVKQKVARNNVAHGDRLYVVYADQYEEHPGNEAWAGLGWTITTKQPRMGLFLEQRGAHKKEVIENLRNGLNDMIKTRTPQRFGVIQYKTIGIRCAKKPVCALVAAVYRSEPW